MKNLAFLLSLLLVPVAGWAGDSSQPDVRVVVLKEARDVAAVDEVRAGRNANGFLTVQASLRNKTDRDQEIQVQALFYDASGNPLGDAPGNPAAWATLPVTATTSVPYRAQALSKAADRVVIQVRLLHRPS